MIVRLWPRVRQLMAHAMDTCVNAKLDILTNRKDESEVETFDIVYIEIILKVEYVRPQSTNVQQISTIARQMPCARTKRKVILVGKLMMKVPQL